MIVIVCLDTACGMMFAHRRLSRDCEVTRRIQTICKGKKLWMNSYSARLYGDLKETHVLVKEDFLSYAKKGEFCLVETTQLAFLEAEIEGIYIFWWNRAYPADLHFDLDLAKEVCARNGWEFVAQPIDWDAKDALIGSGTINCIWNGFTMTGREDSYTFSEPYVDNSIVFVVLADSDIQTAADLAGKVVVTQADSSALSALESEDNAELTASFATLEQIADYNSAFMNLEAGVDDAIAVDIGVAQYQLQSRGYKFRMREEPLSTEQYAIGFKQGNTELRDQVQETLDEMLADGTFDEIVANYTDYNLDQMVCLGK